MTVSPRPYTPADLPRLLHFVGECNRLTDLCGCLHPGDIVHGMSNTLRGQGLERHYHLYEEDGELVALVILYPARQGLYDLIVHPGRRDLEPALVTWGTNAMWSLMQAAQQEAQIEQDWLGFDVMDCDTTRQQVLIAQGYTREAEPFMVYNTRSLADPIPPLSLPEGFTIQHSDGESDLEQLCEVHRSAFSSTWTPDQYRRVVQTPGFDPQRELVAVAPDGRYAAFTIYWLDPVSKSGLFEPVGARQDFQRRGLTRQLMYEGMRHMVAAGMTTAAVACEMDNDAAVGLYHAVGFRPHSTITDYRKVMRSS